MRERLGAFCIASCLLWGCGAPASTGADAAASSQGDALVTTNGRHENGRHENGRHENGRHENGRHENGRHENGRHENGRHENGRHENGTSLGETVVSVDLSPAVVAGRGLVLDASLQGSTLVGHAGQTALSGADFVGASFVATLGSGLPTLVRITGHGYADAPNADLDLYNVEWLAPGGHWRAMCIDDDDAPEPATALYGYWDYTEGTATGGAKTESTHKITFACQSGAIYKCIDWGYRPWESANGTSLSAYHQACTRMTRADYCGDGVSHTVDGAWIGIYDNAGIQLDDASWQFEAQWNEDGATCIAPGGVAHPHRIGCYNQKVSTACVANDPSAMLSSETPDGAREDFPTEPSP